MRYVLVKSLAILLVFLSGVSAFCGDLPSTLADQSNMLPPVIVNGNDNGFTYTPPPQAPPTVDIQMPIQPITPPPLEVDLLSSSCNDISIKFAGAEFPIHENLSARCYASRQAAEAACLNGVVKDLSDPRYEVTGDVPSLNHYYCLKAPSGLESTFPRVVYTNQDLCENHRIEISVQFRWWPTIFETSGLEPGDCQCRTAYLLGQTKNNSEGYHACNSTQAVDAARNGDAAPKSATTAATQNQQPQQPTETFEQCIARAKSTASQCKTTSEQLSSRCSVSSSSDNTAGVAASAAGTMANVYTQTRAGSGSQSSCFNAGLLSNAARITAVATSDSCKSGVESCHNNCPENAYEDFRKQCAALVNNMSPEALESSGTPQAQAFHEMSVEIQPKFAAGASACQTQGDDKLGSLNQMLGGVGNALQGSLRCACQLASGCATAQTIPLAQDCVNNPSLAGCQVYSEMSVCTPGATYNAALCRCQTNPSADGCADVKTTGTLASMASGLIQTNSNGTSAFAAAPTVTPSSGAANNLDLSGGTGSSGVSLDTTAKSGAGGSRQPYVGGGGGIGGGSGGASPQAQNAAGVESEKDGILGGFMNAIKTGARALGFSRNQNNGGYRGGSFNGSNTKTFAPRGLAGGRSGVGSRNMEIWTMMNRCMQADTCPSNSGQFISGP